MQQLFAMIVGVASVLTWRAGAGGGCAAAFGCFQTAFVSGSLNADGNCDGVLTVLDFGAFQSRWVAGLCP